jgi:hypothetical protein
MEEDMRTYSVSFERLIDGLPVESKPTELKAQNMMACMTQISSTLLTFGGFENIISIDIQEVER